MERAGQGEIEKEEEMDLLKYGVLFLHRVERIFCLPDTTDLRQKKKLKEEQESTTVFFAFHIL